MSATARRHRPEDGLTPLDRVLIGAGLLLTLLLVGVQIARATERGSNGIGHSAHSDGHVTPIGAGDQVSTPAAAAAGVSGSAGGATRVAELTKGRSR